MQRALLQLQLHLQLACTHTHTATPPYTPHKTHTRMQTQLTQFSWVWKLAFAHFEILSCSHTHSHTHAYTCKPPHTHAKRTVRSIFDIKAKSRWKNTKYLIVIYSLTLPHTLTLPHSYPFIHSPSQSMCWAYSHVKRTGIRWKIKRKRRMRSSKRKRKKGRAKAIEHMQMNSV